MVKMLTMNMIKFKKTFFLFLFGALCGIAVTYPYDFFQKEYSEGWSKVEEMNSLYQHYVKQHGREPEDLSFLPEEIRKDMKNPECPVKYNHETGNLTSRVSFKKFNVINYLLGRKIDSIGVLIGHIEGRNSKQEE